ncbi:hypothetical protein Tco_1387117 [Tanacetum coccineum]
MTKCWTASIVIPPPSTDITIGARITVRPQASISLPPRGRVTAALPSPPLPPLPPSLYIPQPVDRFRYEIGESSTARPTRGRGIDYGFVSTIEVEERCQGVNTRVTELAELHEHDTQDLYALLEDCSRINWWRRRLMLPERLRPHSIDLSQADPIRSTRLAFQMPSRLRLAALCEMIVGVRQDVEDSLVDERHEARRWGHAGRVVSTAGVHVSNLSPHVISSHRESLSISVAVFDMPGDASRMHIHDHNGSKALHRSLDSILSSELKPLEKHKPPPPPSILSPGESFYPP